MALDLKRKSITREKDGTLSLSIALIETDDGSQIASDTVQGADADEIESKLRPRLEAALAKYSQQKQLEAAADARIEALKNEILGDQS